MGPATLPTSVTIPGQANTAANPNLPLLQGHTIRSHGKLLTIQ